MLTNDAYLTAGQVLKMVPGSSYWWLREQERKGIFTVVHLSPRTKLFLRSEIEAWLKAHFPARAVGNPITPQNEKRQRPQGVLRRPRRVRLRS